MGQCLRRLKARAQERSWGKNVHFVGRLNDIEDIAMEVRKSDYYVTCSKQDGTSAALIEAMASGLICVASDIPGNKEWITHGETGYLFPVGNPSALAKILAEVLEDPNAHKEVAARARKKIQSKLSPESYRLKMLNIYKSVL